MDLTDRQGEALKHDISLSMTAGAGTGKTRVLVEKYLDILDKVPDAKVSNILALTFTDKAAAEMKERIIKEVRKRAGMDSIKEEMLYSNISTIHAFCSQVIRAFPIELGIDPGFGVIDDMDDKILKDEIISEILYTEQHKDIRDNVLRLLKNSSEFYLKEAINELYEKRPLSDDIKDEFLSKKKEDVITEWKVMTSQYPEQLILDLINQKDIKDAIDKLERIANNYPGTENPWRVFLREFESIKDDLVRLEDPKLILSSMKKYIKIEETNVKGERISRSVDLIDQKALRENKDILVKKFQNGIDNIENRGDDDLDLTYEISFDLLKIYSRFSDLMRDRKEAMNVIDFTDMISTVYRFFRDETDLVKEHFSGRFRYILLDEFQDTDPSQWTIILKLAGEIVNGNDRLFIVGDPKQSVYRFRKADVTLFKKARKMIVDNLKGKNIDLDINFRSTPAVMDFVNYLFMDLLVDNGKDWEFDYEPLKVSDQRIKDEGSVEFLLKEKEKGLNGTELVLGRTMLVAARIKEIVLDGKKKIYWDEDGKHLDVPRDPEYGDIAILFRTKTHLKLYEYALREFGIPYHVHGGFGLYEKQEILDIFNILSFLENPTDELSLYGILRSPYFGRSDEELIKLWRSDGFGILAKMDKDPKFHRDHELITAWLEKAGNIPITELLWKIISESDIYTIFGSMKGTDGEQARANVEKIISVARKAQSSGFRSLADFTKMIGKMIEESQKEGESQLDIGSGNNVTLMTVHMSKGLEFPIVVVPELCGNRRNDNSSIHVEEDLGLGVKVPSDDEKKQMESSAVKKVMDLRNKSQEEAEYRRVFYVACTRAKDHLILSGIPPKKSRGSRWINHIICRFDIKDYVGDVHSYSYDLEGEEREFQVEVRMDIPNMEKLKDRGKPSLIIPPDKPILVSSQATEELKALEDEHIYSPSEINMLIEDPKKHHEIYVQGAPDGVITRSSLDIDAATRGTIIHEVFEGKSPKMVLKKFGKDDPELESEYQDAYSKFIGSKIMKDVVEDHKELSFRIRLGEHILSGYIDRVVKKATGEWYIIDYKTGTVDNSNKQQKADEFAIQLSIYKKAVKQLLRAESKLLIYFSKIGEFVEVEEVSIEDEMNELKQKGLI